MYRVFVGGLKHESNSFSSLITSIKDFTVLSPSEVLEKEYSTYLRNTGFEVVSTIVAYAPPAGLVEKHAYLELKERILQDLEKAKKLDGVYLDLHGAMEVEDLGSGELDLVKSIREIVGYDIPISASFDLHGNIPAELVEELDILVAYRTAPHVDAEETRLKAVSLLAKQIKKKVNTSRAIVKPPML
ncbi:MAG TPA: M81 family peptidase, partial [Thermoprotei archaeon]|nr:M81 family peptidase [Thermoprotei archaeon]